MRQEEVLDVIAGRVLARLEECNLQDLANTVWAFATLAARQAELLGELAGRALVRFAEFNPQGLTSMA